MNELIVTDRRQGREGATLPPQEGDHAVAVANPLDSPVAEFRSALDRRGANRKALMEWVRASLVSGTDYGKIHVVSKSKCQRGNQCDNPYHWSKDCLFKPGAEKICGMLSVTPTFPTLPDYEKAALSGVAVQQIILRCHLQTSDGRIVADGVGARSLEQDYGDMNKALKMAAKSAHIDATLRMAGLSEVFTQDIDQMKSDGALEKADGAEALKVGHRTVNPAASATAGSSPARPNANEDGTPLAPEFIQEGRHRGKRWEEASTKFLSETIRKELGSLEHRVLCQKELDRRAAVMQGDTDIEEDDDDIPF